MSVLWAVMSTLACTAPASACDAQARTGVDANLIQAICLVESNADEKALVPQDGGSPSYGACQIKFKTAQHLGFTGTTAELMQPSNNYYWAARYLKYNILRYKNVEQGVSAYNAGHAVDFNKEYVQKVLRMYNQLSN